MDLEPLLPCPFCGAHAVVDQNEGYRWWCVICTGCGVCTSETEVNSEAEAIAKWNQRTYPDCPRCGAAHWPQCPKNPFECAYCGVDSRLSRDVQDMTALDQDACAEHYQKRLDELKHHSASGTADESK